MLKVHFKIPSLGVSSKKYNSMCMVTSASATSQVYILEDFENASPYFCTFLQNVYAIEKLLAGFNVQPRIGINQSLI